MGIIFCRFSLIQRTGNPCSALAFALRRRTEYLVAMSDYSLKCFDTGKWTEISCTHDNHMLIETYYLNFILIIENWNHSGTTCGKKIIIEYNSFICIHLDTKELVAWMKGHESVINNISVHSSGRYAITSSNDTAQLWDLDTFQRKRKLNIKENVGIVKV